MKFTFCLLFMFLLVACNGDQPKPPTVRFEITQHCSTEAERHTLSKFVVDCATAANPKSDEEGEDLVRQCQITAEAILCPEHRHKVTYVYSNDGRLLSERIDEVDNDGNLAGIAPRVEKPKP